MGNRQITRKISYAAATTLLVLGGTWGLTGCEGAAGKTAAKDVPTKTSLAKDKPKSTATQPAEMTFTVAATGDALTHDALMPDVSRDAAGNTHFTNLMAGIKPFLEGLTWRFAIKKLPSPQTGPLTRVFLTSLCRRAGRKT